MQETLFFQGKDVERRQAVNVMAISANKKSILERDEAMDFHWLTANITQVVASAKVQKKIILM